MYSKKDEALPTRITIREALQDLVREPTMHAPIKADEVFLVPISKRARWCR